MIDGRKTILLVSPFVPFPPARGIELRIYRLLKWMKQAGYEVILVVSAEGIDAAALRELRSITSAVHWLRPAYRTRLGAQFPHLRRVMWESVKPIIRYISRIEWFDFVSSKDIEYKPEISASRATVSKGPIPDQQVIAWFSSDRLVHLVGRLSRKYRPHAVITEYIFSSPVFTLVPEGTLKIIDTIDVFSRKEEQVLAYGIADPFACSEDEERRHLLKADVIVAIQSREARLLQELAPEREVVLAGMDFDAVSETLDAPLASSILVVASGNSLNVHGLTAFLEECWPLIKSAKPTATLHVVGKVGYACQLDDQAIRYSGWIDDLDQVYREASVVINPTVAGTGLKIKSVQALAHGKPLVAWTNGVEGLEFSGDPPFRECRSWQEFAEAVVSLLHSDAERNALASRALAYARSEFAADTVYAALRDRLNQGVAKDVSAAPGTESPTRNPRFQLTR